MRVLAPATVKKRLQEVQTTDTCTRCDVILDRTDQLQMDYQTCRNCLFPGGTD